MRKYLLLLLGILSISLNLHNYIAFGEELDSHIRVLHASPDAPNVDIYFDNKKMFSEVKYKHLSDYTKVSKSDYLYVYPEGANPKKEIPIIKEKIEVTKDDTVTIAIVGIDDEFQVKYFKDEHSLNESKAKVRFIHLSPDTETIDVLINGELALTNLSYMKNNKYEILKPGKKNMTLQLSNGNERINKKFVSMEIFSKANYSIFLIGLTEGEPELEVVITKDHLIKK